MSQQDESERSGEDPDHEPGPRREKRLTWQQVLTLLALTFRAGVGLWLFWQEHHHD